MDVEGGKRAAIAIDAVSTADASGREEPVAVQQAFWSSWNSLFIERPRGPTSQRQAQEVTRWLDRLGRRDLDILDVGCGSGWMCAQLRAYGRVTGTDFCDDILVTARRRLPEVCFVPGDFMTVDLPFEAADVVVTLETLAHMRDQPAFLQRIARMLRPGGQLMIATQNRFVFERWQEVPPRAGQIRQWTSVRELRALLEKDFVIDELFTVVPFAHGGVLRVINSVKLNRWLASVFGQARLDRWKERAGLGHTVMALARRR